MTSTPITKQTRVELALVVTVVASFSAAAVWLQGKLTDLQTTCSTIEFEQTRVRDKLDAMNRELWTLQQMENWTLRLKLANESLSVPSSKGTGEVR